MSNNGFSNELQGLAQTYGRWGLIPFVSSALMVWVVPEDIGLGIANYFIFYSAIIMSFLSAGFWYSALLMPGQSDELSLNGNDAKKRLTMGIILSLLGWVSLLLPLIVGLILLSAGFLLMRQF